MFNSYYLKDLNTTVFDIETTGLFHSKDCIINAGFCSPMGDVWQNFTEDPTDEKRVVEEALERICAADAVVTYNGDTFDLPFLQRRAVKYGLCERLPLLWSVDLYRWLKKYWPVAPSMKSMSQKSVEEAMGLAPKRSDEIPGGDCIPLYNYYLQTKDDSAKQTILLHNADDVRQLARIAWKCTFLPYHDIAMREGFLFKAGQRKILTKGCSFKRGRCSCRRNWMPDRSPSPPTKISTIWSTIRSPERPSWRSLPGRKDRSATWIRSISPATRRK